MREYTIEDQRNFAVIKSNDFIQKSRFKLSVPEQKIIWYIISKVKFEDDDFKYYDFSISDFCKVCNIDHESGGNSDLVKESLKKLADKSMYIDTGENLEKTVLMRWISKVIFYKGKGIVSIRLDEDLKPYLLKLGREYTSLDLSIALSMSRKYSIRLYEILRCYTGLTKKRKEFELSELKEKLDATHYDKFNDFKVNVLTPALEEINEFADFMTTYTLSKTGRTYTKIEFKFKDKDGNQNYEAIKKIEKKLTSKEKQITFV